MSAPEASDTPNTSRAPIALLTDFGFSDGYVGIMKGVILGIAPQTPLVDLTHEIPAQDVLTGAWALHTAWHYFPKETVFLCVVDPGVGSTRNAIALRAGERTFVGPDNGLFSYVLAATSPERIVALDQPRYHRPRPSATFHGRDIFAPCAAHLAAGVPLGDLGTPLTLAQLTTLALPAPLRDGDMLIGHIVHIDHFGNLITDLGPELADTYLAAPDATMQIGASCITARVRAFADALEGEPFALRDSSGHLAIAIRNGSAARALGVERGTSVLVMGLDLASLIDTKSGD